MSYCFDCQKVHLLNGAIFCAIPQGAHAGHENDLQWAFAWWATQGHQAVVVRALPRSQCIHYVCVYIYIEREREILDDTGNIMWYLDVNSGTSNENIVTSRCIGWGWDQLSEEYPEVSKRPVRCNGESTISGRFPFNISFCRGISFIPEIDKWKRDLGPILQLWEALSRRIIIVSKSPGLHHCGQAT